jgi:dihydroorotate dehydrogenase (NAD+) catalytic subunit
MSEVNLAGVLLRNPVIAASGTFGYGREYAPFIDVAALGGICTKGLTLRPREGNGGRRIWETPSGLLNSIGLENPGIEAFIERELPPLRALGPAVIANLGGSTLADYADGARLLDAAPIDMVELYISCPNLKSGGMAFGLDPDAAARVVSAVRRALPSRPLMVKLSPNAPDINAVAFACIDAGADALSLVNTFKAMAIDTATGRPVFDNISAGLSGPAIRPLALRMVWELCRALEERKSEIPVVGLGGIACLNDAREFLLAGARAIQVGSATFANPRTMTDIIDGLVNGKFWTRSGNVGKKRRILDTSW